MSKGLSVIVLNWNGEALLTECLPKVMSEIESSPVLTELIVIDNGSTDGSLAFLRSLKPAIRLISLPQNLGFSKANNLAVQEAEYDTLLFLNNDLYLEAGFFEPMLAALESREIFAVAPKILRFDRETIDDGLRYGTYDWGLFSVVLQSDKRSSEKRHHVTFFCGACFMCRKADFTRLGGFDELYSPYAWEDLDLGYRAWKRGFKVEYVPSAVAYHKREATTREVFSRTYFESLVWRNRFIFTWKNLHSKRLILDHLVHLPFKLLKFLFNGRWRYCLGFCKAITHYREILKRRKAEERVSILSDEVVLKHSFAPINEPARKSPNPYVQETSVL